MPSDDRTSDHRRINKPIMEKRRRARINDSLTQLKSLVLEGLKKDPARHSKLEKADILEMAVKHLRSLQARPERALNRYRDGYVECRREVAAYLSSDPGLDGELKRRLLAHLGQGAPPPPPSPPTAAALPALSAGLGSLQLVPASLPGGQIAFLLPSPAAGRPAGAAAPAVAGLPPPPAPLSACFEPAAASVGSPSPVPSSQAEPEPGWDPAAPSSPSSSVGSFGSCEGRADSPRPLDLVAHNRGSDEEAHWRPW